MNYFFNRDGKKEAVIFEKWVWIAYYQDGTILKQFDDTGEFHQIGEIDQSKLKLFRMQCTESDQFFDIKFNSGMRIIHKYLRYIFNANTPRESRVVIYCFGYKIGKNYHYNYILPDNSLVQSIDENIKLNY